MRRLLLATAAMLLLTAGASAQTPATTTTTTLATTLRIALREDPDTLDPTLARTYVSRIVFAGLCDKLFDIDEKLQVVPQLALSYEWTTPAELLIKLRPNVVFQDGTPDGRRGRQVFAGTAPDHAGQLPPQRDQCHGPRGRRGPADGAYRAESPVPPPSSPSSPTAPA